MILARKSASYCPSPGLLSQSPTSMAALPGPEPIILRLKHPVQGRAVEEPGLGHHDPTALPVSRSGMGHEDAFPRPRLSARCWFSQGTFAGTWGNGRDAPIPDLPTLTPEREVRPFPDGRLGAHEIGTPATPGPPDFQKRCSATPGPFLVCRNLRNPHRRNQSQNGLF